MPNPTIKAKPGFDWSRVQWGGPNDQRTEKCSYCGKKFPTEDEDEMEIDFVPLIIWKVDGSCAEFCDDCQATWFGVSKF